MTVVWWGTVGMGVRGNHGSMTRLRARDEEEDVQLPDDSRKIMIYDAKHECNKCEILYVM